MVSPRPKRHDVLQQGREPPDAPPKNDVLGEPRAPERLERKEDGGRPPYPGEVVGNKQPPYEVVGTDALSPLLWQVDFPATRAEVVDRIGEARIPIDRQHTMTVREILDQVTPVTFRSSAEVEAAVQRVWDQILPHSGEGRGSHQRQRDNLSGRTPN